MRRIEVQNARENGHFERDKKFLESVCFFSLQESCEDFDGNGFVESEKFCYKLMQLLSRYFEEKGAFISVENNNEEQMG